MVLLHLIGNEFILHWRSSMKNKFEGIDIPIIELGDKKLILSPLALQILNVNPGDRLSINYIQKNNENTFPVIGKAEIFADPENGQKLTKSNTISFRGNQHKFLKQFGNLFKIEMYAKNIYKMVAINDEKEIINI